MTQKKSSTADTHTQCMDDVMSLRVNFCCEIVEFFFKVSLVNNQPIQLVKGTFPSKEILKTSNNPPSTTTEPLPHVIV